MSSKLGISKIPNKASVDVPVIGAWSLRHSISCGDGQGPIGIDQNIVLNVRKWSALQLTGQPPAISEIFVQPGGRQRERVVVPYFRRRAKALQRPPRTIRQWSIRARDSSATTVSQRSDTQNVRSILANAPALHRGRRLRPSARRIKGCLRNTQTSSKPRPRQPSDWRRGVYGRYFASGLLTIAVTEAV
jgi:hypothetical protein